MAQALPTYTMSLYYLPFTYFEKFERIFNKYWREAKPSAGSGMHWMSWDRLCVPKKIGGLGFKKLHQFNIALLAKQGWRLMSNTNSIVVRLMKERYYPNSTFLEAHMGPTQVSIRGPFMQGNLYLHGVVFAELAMEQTPKYRINLGSLIR